jgi:hypothetical protein
MRLGRVEIRMNNSKWDTWQPPQRGIGSRQLRHAAAEALELPSSFDDNRL